MSIQLGGLLDHPPKMLRRSSSQAAVLCISSVARDSEDDDIQNVVMSWLLWRWCSCLQPYMITINGMVWMFSVDLTHGQKCQIHRNGMQSVPGRGSIQTAWVHIKSL